MDFADWLDKEIEKGPLNQAGLARRATDPRTGKGLDDTIIGYLRKRKRQATAEHAVRIARGLKRDFLEVLYRAGFITEDELKRSTTAVHGFPVINRIMALLNELTEEELESAEKTITAAVETELDRREKIKVLSHTQYQTGYEQARMNRGEVQKEERQKKSG